MRLFFMSYVQGEDRGQAALLPAAIEDYVAADAPVTTRYIEHLETADKETLLISLSDKVHNARSILRDLANLKSGSLFGSDLRAKKKGHFGNIASWQMRSRGSCRGS